MAVIHARANSRTLCLLLLTCFEAACGADATSLMPVAAAGLAAGVSSSPPSSAPSSSAADKAEMSGHEKHDDSKDCEVTKHWWPSSHWCNTR